MYWMIEDLGSLSPAFAMGFGLVVGLAHAFEADHVAAVGSQASGGKSGKPWRRRIAEGVTRSSVMGMAWGAGHATTLVLFGMAVYLAASVIQDWVFSGLEAGVGVMLLALGASAILGRGILWPVHKHHHSHADGTGHAHLHGHDDGRHGHTHRSYVIGLVHGLAGSGGLVALTASTMDGPAMMLAFMLAFGTGAALGMCAAGGLLGIPIAAASGNKKTRRISRYAAGAFSVAVGAAMLYQIGAAAMPGLPAA